MVNSDLGCVGSLIRCIFDVETFSGVGQDRYVILCLDLSRKRGRISGGIRLSGAVHEIAVPGKIYGCCISTHQIVARVTS